MAFGWLTGKKDPVGKALEKGRKLSAQGRWAEALTYFEEALGADAGSAEARDGLRTCRERLVDSNLEEARGYATAQEPEKAREHGQLALELAAGEAELQERARRVLAELGGPAPAAAQEAPTRLFAPSCACAAPCGPEEAQMGQEDLDVESLFEFYLESLSAPERGALAHLGSAFREGFVHLQQGETDAARGLLEKAAEEAPEEAGPPYALGLLAALERDWETAAASFSVALERDPGYAPAAHHRADVLREGGKPAEAATTLTAWLGEHPEDGEAWALLGMCRLEAGDPEAALDAAGQAEQRTGPEDPRPKLLKARILLLLGHPDQALGALQAVAARRPDLLEALVPMGQILIKKGGPSAERAAEVFKHCYRLDPERGWWHLLRIAEAYAARGWKDEARDVLAQAQEQLPEAEEARGQWEEVSRGLG